MLFLLAFVSVLCLSLIGALVKVFGGKRMIDFAATPLVLSAVVFSTFLLWQPPTYHPFWLLRLAAIGLGSAIVFLLIASTVEVFIRGRSTVRFDR